MEDGEEWRPRVRGAGGLESGAGELVGAAEHAEDMEEVVLEAGILLRDREVDALEEAAEGGQDVACGGEGRAEVDGGGEEGVDDAERGDLRGAVGEVGGSGARAHADGGGGPAAAEAGGVGVAAGEGEVEVARADDAGLQRWCGLGRGGRRQGVLREPAAAAATSNAAPHGRRSRS
uniref:Uncharacterized protein n=1 Tax=Arundo donax TaxID=35708 RepID=A0A0A9FIS0_ARUDO